jgi:hypothetical protein
MLRENPFDWVTWALIADVVVALGFCVWVAIVGTREC